MLSRMLPEVSRVRAIERGIRSSPVLLARYVMSWRTPSSKIWMSSFLRSATKRPALSKIMTGTETISTSAPMMMGGRCCGSCGLSAPR